MTYTPTVINLSNLKFQTWKHVFMVRVVVLKLPDVKSTYSYNDMKCLSTIGHIVQWVAWKSRRSSMRTKLLNNCAGVWGSYLVVDHVRSLLPHGLDSLEDVHFSLHLDPLHLTHCSNEHTSAGHAITDKRRNCITFCSIFLSVWLNLQTVV